jgi:hypothetical protein
VEAPPQCICHQARHRIINPLAEEQEQYRERNGQLSLNHCFGWSSATEYLVSTLSRAPCRVMPAVTMLVESLACCLQKQHSLAPCTYNRESRFKSDGRFRMYAWEPTGLHMCRSAHLPGVEGLYHRLHHGALNPVYGNLWFK